MRREREYGRRSNKSASSSTGVSSWLFFWSIALLGFSILQLRGQSSAYYSARYALPEHAEGEKIGDFSHRLDGLSVEIFSAPKPFIGEDKDFGINIEHRVDKNFLGVPLFNSMLTRANNSRESITIIINGDILLFDDFMQTIRKVVSNFEHFLIIGARYDVDNLPKDVTENDEHYTRKIREHVLSTGTLHTYGGMDVWAWNTDGPRLFDPIMPHFIFGRGKYDNWLTHETIAAGRRQVVDVSETCLTVHIRHDYHLVTGGAGGDDISGTGRRLSGAFWSEGKKSKFELFINIYLSLHTGTYTNQMGNVLFAPWKLSLCLEPMGMCLLKRKRPGICNCEYSSFVGNTQTDPVVKNGSRVIRCGMISVETKDNFVIPVLPPDGTTEAPAFGLPLTMRSVIDRVVINNTIILSALNFGYREIMMNWVCNMRHLGITNFVIAALDADLYKFAYTHGLPTYFENTIFQGLNSSLIADASYGTDSFKQLTKMKSRVVVRLLREGYNVVWSDCDIILFKNPLENMWSYNADLVIQTNAPDNEPMNGRRRINSGFYLARSNAQTIRGFEDVIKYASRSRMSEQPCFYDVLCGKKGETSVGVTGCMYQGMNIQLLDRHVYPNGITDGIWDTEPGMIPKKFPALYILHNNWVKGAGGKQARFERHGFILYDKETELCVYPETW